LVGDVGDSPSPRETRTSAPRGGQVAGSARNKICGPEAGPADGLGLLLLTAVAKVNGT